MDNLNEEIDLVLAESLLEYTDARDFRVTQTAVSKKEKETQDRFAGLNKKLATEMVGFFRLVAIRVLQDPSLSAAGAGRTFAPGTLPDFILQMPDLGEIQVALRKHLNYDEDRSEYILDTSSFTRVSALRNFFQDKINTTIKFVRGQDDLEVDGETYNISFKNYVNNFWSGREEQIEEFIKTQTGIIIKKISSAAPPRGRVDDDPILPSEIAKNTKYSFFYEKVLVPYLNSNQRKVDDQLNAILGVHAEAIEAYKDMYKTDNKQDTTPPQFGWRPGRGGTFNNTRASWDKFVNEYLQTLYDITNKAKDDYLAQYEASWAGATTYTPGRGITARPGAARPPFSGGTDVLPENLIKEDKLATITIDFNELKKQKLDESFLAMFGGWVEHILGAMFGGKTLPLVVKGSQRDVESFANTLRGEKSYLDAVKRYGLDHPTTYRNKANLNNAIKGFERETGLKWPFK